MIFLPIAFYIGYTRKRLSVFILFLAASTMANAMLGYQSEQWRAEAGMRSAELGEILIGALIGSAAAGSACIAIGRAIRSLVDRKKRHD